MGSFMKIKMWLICILSTFLVITPFLFLPCQAEAEEVIATIKVGDYTQDVCVNPVINRPRYLNIEIGKKIIHKDRRRMN